VISESVKLSLFQRAIATICLSGLFCLAGCSGNEKSESERFYLPRDRQSYPRQELADSRHRLPVSSSTVSKPANDPLEESIDISKLNHAMPFGEAIDVLRSAMPKFNIVVMWKNLEENGIYRNTPIEIDGVSDLSFRQSLNILLLGVSSRQTKLAYDVDGNIITIATEDSLHRSMATKVYNIGDISSKRANVYTNPDELNRNATSTNSSTGITATPTATGSR
jgi:hypothetical protein